MPELENLEVSEVVTPKEDTTAKKEYEEMEQITRDQIVAITKRANAQKERIKKALDDKLQFRIDLSDDDSLSLNKREINNKKRKANSVSIEVKSETAKEEIEKKTKLSISEIEKRIAKLKDGEVRGYAKNSLVNIFKKMAKAVVILGD